MEFTLNIFLGRQSRVQIMVTEVRHRRSRDREKEEREGENFKELN